MLILGLDTATESVAAAVVDIDTGAVLGRGEHRGRASHGEQLAPMVAQALASAGAHPGDLSAIGVGRGPGPFTGLRVGLAHAAVMGWAEGIAVYGVCTLDVLALQARRAGLRGPFLVATDARRREVYWAAYDASGARVTGPFVNAATDIPDRTRPAVGAGAAAYADAFTDVRPPLMPDPAVLAEMVGTMLVSGAPMDTSPMYLRRPDAIESAGPKRVTPR